MNGSRPWIKIRSDGVWHVGGMSAIYGTFPKSHRSSGSIEPPDYPGPKQITLKIFRDPVRQPGSIRRDWPPIHTGHGSHNIGGFEPEKRRDTIGFQGTHSLDSPFGSSIKTLGNLRNQGQETIDRMRERHRKTQDSMDQMIEGQRKRRREAEQLSQRSQDYSERETYQKLTEHERAVVEHGRLRANLNLWRGEGLEQTARRTTRVEPLWSKQEEFIADLLTFGAAGMKGLSLDRALDITNVREVIRDYYDEKSRAKIVETGPQEPQSGFGVSISTVQVPLAAGMIRDADLDDLMKELGDEYAKSVAAAENSVPKSRIGRGGAIGRMAEEFFKKGARKILKRRGIDPESVIDEPFTGATGRRGGPTRFDLSFGTKRRDIVIELKATEYGGKRVNYQLEGQLIRTGAGVGTRERPVTFYRIVAGTRTIQKWTTEALRRTRWFRRL
jgi:hypothetical protein